MGDIMEEVRIQLLRDVEGVLLEHAEQDDQRQKLCWASLGEAKSVLCCRRGNDVRLCTIAKSSLASLRAGMWLMFVSACTWYIVVQRGKAW